jgi:hypothetical protein
MNGDISKEVTSFSGLYQPNGVHKNDEYIEDLEDDDHHHMPGAIPTISKQVSNHMSLANGHVGIGVNSNSNKNSAKFNHNNRPSANKNGYIANGRSNFRTMLEDAEMDSHI